MGRISAAGPESTWVGSDGIDGNLADYPPTIPTVPEETLMKRPQTRASVAPCSNFCRASTRRMNQPSTSRNVRIALESSEFSDAVEVRRLGTLWMDGWMDGWREGGRYVCMFVPC